MGGGPPHGRAHPPPHRAPPIPQHHRGIPSVLCPTPNAATTSTHRSYFWVKALVPEIAPVAGRGGHTEGILPPPPPHPRYPPLRPGTAVAAGGQCRLCAGGEGPSVCAWAGARAGPQRGRGGPGGGHPLPRPAGTPPPPSWSPCLLLPVPVSCLGWGGILCGVGDREWGWRSGVGMGDRGGGRGGEQGTGNGTGE